MGNGKFSFLVMSITLLIIFIGFIDVVFDLRGFLFITEFLFLGILMFFTLISMVLIYNDAKFGWTLMTFILAFILIDFLFIYLFKLSQSSLLLLTAVVGLVGFIISVVNIKGPEELEEPEDVEEISSSVKKEFKPGKYIASKTGAKFHSPKCDWAKKIKKANRVWFDSKEEARKAGYKTDDCV